MKKFAESKKGCIFVSQGSNKATLKTKKPNSMPFTNRPPHTLSRKVSEKQRAFSLAMRYKEQAENAIKQIEFWTEILNKKGVSIELQRKCLFEIEGEELIRDKNEILYKEAIAKAN